MFFPQYYFPDRFRKRLASGFYTIGKMYFATANMFKSYEGLKTRIGIVTRSIRKLFYKSEIEIKKQETKKAHLELDQMHDLAVSRYVIHSQDIDVDLMVASDNVYYKHDKTYFGWKNLALKGVKRHNIPGNHANMFTPPNDAEVGRILQGVLDGEN